MSVALKKSVKKSVKDQRLKKLKFENGRIAYVADHPITLDEFCDLFGDDDVELIDGVAIERMATQYSHEALFRFIYVILNLYVDKNNLGIALGSRTLVPITNYKGRLPDILFVSKERENIIDEKRLIDAPDLVIEIISPNDRQLETMQRLGNYEQIGVKEFWIIDQPRKKVQAFFLDEDTKKFSPLDVKDSILTSNVVKGFWINIDWLWQKPLPSVLEVFKEIAGNEM
ncbi:MAG: hypothetical protein QG588_2296 [Candidatus Poribacteria bacterium]|nr:hypothetical protein [Candidatus Poribacteria bacterium]